MNRQSSRRYNVIDVGSNKKSPTCCSSCGKKNSSEEYRLLQEENDAQKQLINDLQEQVKQLNFALTSKAKKIYHLKQELKGSLKKELHNAVMTIAQVQQLMMEDDDDDNEDEEDYDSDDDGHSDNLISNNIQQHYCTSSSNNDQLSVNGALSVNGSSASACSIEMDQNESPRQQKDAARRLLVNREPRENDENNDDCSSECGDDNDTRHNNNSQQDQDGFPSKSNQLTNLINNIDKYKERLKVSQKQKLNDIKSYSNHGEEKMNSRQQPTLTEALSA